MVEIPEMIQQIIEWGGPALVIIGGILCGAGFSSYSNSAFIAVILTVAEPVLGFFYFYLMVKGPDIIIGIVLVIIGGVLLIFLKFNEKFLEGGGV
ncbi:MAG: hypothetical protein ACFFCM_20375 [Promethearchaeota archaeon]